jgi:predicted RNA-binding Zn-ribbon protein involved in translation (DUF1610 family)
MELASVVIVIFVIALVFYIMIWRRAGSQKTFICAGCGREFPHTKRTRQARNFSNRFYCNTCHRNWLESRTERGCFLFGGLIGLILIVATGLLLQQAINLF